MKLKDLKEWGGRDLPGFGDEATWGGRTPYGSDDDEQVDPMADFTRTDMLDNSCFFIDIGEFDIKDQVTDEELAAHFKKLDYKIANDTGHSLVQAFYHSIKPMWLFCCADPDRFVHADAIPELKALTEKMGEPNWSITQIQAGVREWMKIVDAYPNTKQDILS